VGQGYFSMVFLPIDGWLPGLTRSLYPLILILECSLLMQSALTLLRSTPYRLLGLHTVCMGALLLYVVYKK